MTPKLKRLLTRLSENKALIVSDTQGGCVTYAAYPGGDRRCRPVSWISKDVFREWLAAGIVIANGKGYEVAPGVVARRAGAGHGAAQRTLQTESVSGEDGVFRPAQMNLNTRSGFREGWARRSGRTVLKLALQRLAEFYGTTPGARPHQRPDQDASARASL